MAARMWIFDDFNIFDINWPCNEQNGVFFTNKYIWHEHIWLQLYFGDMNIKDGVQDGCQNVDFWWFVIDSTLIGL